MAGSEHQRRRFVTRHDVEDAAAAGRPVVVSGRDVVTDEAAQRAQDLGVRIERDGPARVPGSATSPSAPPAGSTADARAQLRRAVRAAVVAELGREPARLDETIDRVLDRWRR